MHQKVIEMTKVKDILSINLEDDIKSVVDIDILQKQFTQHWVIIGLNLIIGSRQQRTER